MSEATVKFQRRQMDAPNFVKAKLSGHGVANSIYLHNKSLLDEKGNFKEVEIPSTPTRAFQEWYRSVEFNSGETFSVVAGEHWNMDEERGDFVQVVCGAFGQPLPIRFMRRSGDPVTGVSVPYYMKRRVHVLAISVSKEGDVIVGGLGLAATKSGSYVDELQVDSEGIHKAAIRAGLQAFRTKAQPPFFGFRRIGTTHNPVPDFLAKSASWEKINEVGKILLQTLGPGLRCRSEFGNNLEKAQGLLVEAVPQWYIGKLGTGGIKEKLRDNVLHGAYLDAWSWAKPDRAE